MLQSLKRPKTGWFDFNLIVDYTRMALGPIQICTTLLEDHSCSEVTLAQIHATFKL